MKFSIALCLSTAVAASPLLGGEAREDKKPDPAQPMLAHMVFFQLKEKSDASREKLLEACRKYLSKHEGTVYFSAGARAEDLQRDVNDKDFDVALHLVFRNKAAHDKYATHPRHLQFIEECQSLWAKVRVFDSYVSAPAKQSPAKKDEAAAEKLFLPDPAANFSGMIRAKVESKRGARVVVVVEEVLKTWEQSKAQDPKSLVGKKVAIEASKERGDAAKATAAFLKSLQPGETVELDVAHKKGEELTLLELTEAQRKRVEQAAKGKKDK